MPVTIGVLREERASGKRASVWFPRSPTSWPRAGARVLIERGAGVSAQFPDALYRKVEWADSAEAVLARGRRAADGAAADPRRRSRRSSPARW